MAMLEQDVELAKLLMGKTSELEQQSGRVEEELRQVEMKLAELESVRQERSNYEDILSRAASLLGRADLTVESPETDELEIRANDLRAEHSLMAEEAAKYRNLLDELRGRAPQLVAAALGQPLPEADSAGYGAEVAGAGPFDEGREEPQSSGTDDLPDVGDEDPLDDPQPLTISAEMLPDSDYDLQDEEETVYVEPLGGDSEELHAGSNGNGLPAELPEGVDLSVSGLPAMEKGQASVALDDRLSLLTRFNLPLIKTKAASDKGMAFVIDCQSVLDRVPFYDRQRLAMDEAGARDELVRDVSVLGSEIHGGFHLVFSNPHSTRVMHDANLLLESGPAGMDPRSAAAQRVQELVSVYIGQGIPVSVISGDGNIGEQAKKVGAIVFQLGEFFMT